MKLLIVEDEAAIAEVIRAYAAREGYTVNWAADGASAVALWEKEGADVVLLDLMLPKLDGTEVCRRIRASSAVPIIMLTARSGEDDIIAGLDAGADDYVVKPFSPRVLMARLRANVRKNTEPQGAGKIVKVGTQIEIDADRVEVRKDGAVVPMTRNEFLIFSTLASHPVRTWSRDEIIHSALGDEYDGFDRTVDTYIKNLRKKLADSCHENGWIQTIHGFGYRIDDKK